MRYVDSGSRNPKDALGTWLGAELVQVGSLAALRVQTGFFGSDALGYLKDALEALHHGDGHTRFLIGSNDGQTLRGAVADLLAVAGSPRTGLRIGVVSFRSGYFHPKVFHIQRSDGSSTAYVGSANFTLPGTTSLHVEAGLILDDSKGDPTDVLDSVATAIDEWFTSGRPGLYEVVNASDLDALVTAEVLGVVQPPRPERAVQSVKSRIANLNPMHALEPLVEAPPTHTALSRAGKDQHSASTASTPVSPHVTPAPPSRTAAVKHWGKMLSNSDAQRKRSGNQRGAITLVQGDYRRKIDQTTFFRNDLFGQQTWVQGTARTGQPVEKTTVPMNVTIDRFYHGVLEFEVTDGLTRHSGQNNYTAELHVEPIGSIIRQINIAGKHLDITLDSNGEYWLTIE